MAQRRKSGALDVTHGVIWRQLLALCVPIFFSSFFQQAYALVNAYVVGQFGGKVALGGIQATMSLVDLAVGFCVGVGSGCAVIAGQYFGAGDDEKLSRAVHTAMKLAVIGGLCFSVVGLVAIEPILALMGTPAELMGEAVAFGRCYLGALVFSLVFNMGSGIQRAVGDARTPSLIVASTCLVNIVLDLVFVAGFHMEALGCGIATASALAFGAVVTCVRLMRVDAAFRLVPSRLRIDRDICLHMLGTGIPLGVQAAVYSVSNIIAQSAINSFGTDAVTGWGLSGRIDGIVWMISEALGVAVTTFSAQNFGARNYDRMRHSLRVSLGMTLVIIGSISAALVVFVEPIAKLFIDDAGVIANTALMVTYIGPFYVLYSLGANFSGAIRGTGESVRPMIITIVGTCIFRVIWLLSVVPEHHTIEMVLVSYPITWLLTMVLFVVYYRHGRWLTHAKERETRVLG